MVAISYQDVQVNFDFVSKEKIFDSINKASMQTKKELVHDYQLLKNKLGRHPMLVERNMAPEIHHLLSKNTNHIITSFTLLKIILNR